MPVPSTIGPRRSVLLSIGADPATLRTNSEAGADVLCVDLEDTVEAKTAARGLAAAFHQGGYAGRRGLRLNPFSEPDGLRDILMLREASWCPDVVVMTKILDPFELRLADELLPACEIIALIETAESLETAVQIARASSRLTALMFGGKDLSYALGSARTWEALSYGRGRMVNAAASGGVLALDENYRPLDDLEGLEAACRRGRAMGFRGRLTIDARHVPIANAVFAD